MRKFWDYQSVIWKRIMNDVRVALFMEMRLGKTILAIRWAQRMASRGNGSVLVVCPLSVIPTWQYELGEERIMDPIVLGADHGVTWHPRKIWAIVNYERVRSDPAILQRNWDAIILDESTKIKNPKAQVTKLMTIQCREIPARMILSGLPAPESLMDYYSQLQFLFPHWMGVFNFWKWRHQFFRPIGYDWQPKRHTAAMIRRELEDKAIVLRRRDVKMKGGRKIYEQRVVASNPEQRKLYRKARDEWEMVDRWSLPDYAEEPRVEWTKHALQRMIWLHRIAGGIRPGNLKALRWPAKYKELLALLQGELKEENVVVWFRFNAELHAVKKLLRLRGIRTFSITGATPLDKRARVREKFGEKGKPRVLLVQLKCGKYGLDLSAADTAIYYSNGFSMEDRYQSEDRIIHPRKKKACLYVDLITRGTLDNELVELLRSKREESGSILVALARKFRKGGLK